MTEAEPQTYSDVRKLLKARMQTRTVKLPGSDLDVGVRLLTEREMDQTRFASFAYLAEEAKRMGVKPAELVEVDPDLLDREKSRQLIMRAFVAPGGGSSQPFFPSVAAIRETVDAVMVQNLMELYAEHQEVRAAVRKIDDAALESLLPGLASEGSDVLLSYFDVDTVRRITRALAAKVIEGRK